MTSKEKIIDIIVKNNGITSKQISEETGIALKTVSNNLAQVIKEPGIERELKNGLFLYYSSKAVQKKMSSDEPDYKGLQVSDKVRFNRYRSDEILEGEVTKLTVFSDTKQPAAKVKSDKKTYLKSINTIKKI